LKGVSLDSDLGHNRYLLQKEWDKNKSKAMVIMINPSTAGEVAIDYTTLYVINNLYDLDFGSVEIVNLFSNVDGNRRTGKAFQNMRRKIRIRSYYQGKKRIKS